ncbi:MAG: acyl-CoA thioesterase [Ponticaulis sp.]|nr:acyl-CoA thioesterase [Ponticaulis sp.]|tara:strand:+ start:30277 stop:31131 length:855 start_codon:yes stop_codon:yes gene_type:complete
MTSSSTTRFFELDLTDDPHKFTLDVNYGLSVGPPKQKFLFGGVGLASAVRALELSTDRPLIWATAQYLSFALPGETVEVDVRAATEGKSVTQARVLGHVGDREIYTVNAACGTRGQDLDHQWGEMPDVPGPEACDPRPQMRPTTEGEPEDLANRIDTRVALGRYGKKRGEGGLSADGRAILWARPDDPSTQIDAIMLAVIADYVPGATGSALGMHAGSNSLDNTLRIRKIVPTDWVCIDIQIHGIHDGFVHGTARLWAQDGTLMAIASQSGIVRIWDFDAKRFR